MIQLTPADPLKASTLIDLAIISVLVDKGLITADELIVRIEAMQNQMERSNTPGAALLVNGILKELRARPGSLE